MIPGSPAFAILHEAITQYAQNCAEYDDHDKSPEAEAERARLRTAEAVMSAMDESFIAAMEACL